MASGISPLDEVLALGPSQFSPRLVEWAVLFGTLLPFQVAARLVTLVSGVAISGETVRRLTERAGAAGVALETTALERIERELPAPPTGPAVQHLSVDGALVSLRDGSWTEVKTLAIGTVQAQDASASAPTTVDLSYFSRLADADTFGRLATVETQRRGTTTAGTVVGVVDGALWCQGFLDLHRHDAVRILDFPHAVGYLARAADALYPRDPVRARTWLADQRRTLLCGDPELVLARLGESQPPDAADQDEHIGEALRYLTSRRAQIAYAAFRALGYPIGSGTVESANKLIVEARLKGRGMHWARHNVNPLVCLRCVDGNGRWQEQWPQLWGQVRAEGRAVTTTRRQRRQQPVACPDPGPPAHPAPLPPPAMSLDQQPPRPKLVVNGKPTKNHPWRTHALFNRRSA